ncbi:MAG: type VII secretion protein EssC [Lachnospiraceae bacterium]|nr:type VII secretion protein EssC [Lachnospiraceae bacterium]
MSVVLSVYSQSAYKEFVLPAIHNAETVLVLDRKIFHLREDLELRLEVVDEKWSFLPSPNLRIQAAEGVRGDLRLKNQANYRIESVRGEVLSTIVQIKPTSFCNYSKYNFSAQKQITVGSSGDSDIIYSYEYSGFQYISKKHIQIRRVREGVVLEDVSKNGVFVNDARVKGSQKLEFGDNIHIWGMDMVFLDDILAVRQGSNVRVNIQKLRPWNGQTAPATEKPHPAARMIYHRAPRTMEVLETEPVEIEAPPAPRQPGDTPLMMAIGPAMTMAIPMLMSSGMAILGARSSGAHASTFMYTGIVTSLCSAVIGVGWALTNIRYGKDRAKKEENHRFEAFGEYLIKRADEIKMKYEHNIESLLRMYPSAEVCASKEMQDTNKMWERNSTHQDFLQHRLGIGDMPFQVQIQIPKEKFTLINDSLADKPKFIQESYKVLHQVPICLDLMKEHIVGIVGGPDKTGAYQVVYDLVAQIAAQNCYTDVKMAFVFQEDQGESISRWKFARWLPHAWSQDKKVRYVASNKNEATDVFYELTKVLRYRSEEVRPASDKNKIYKPHYILFVEEPSFLEGELISKYIFDKEHSFGLTVFLMAESNENLPNTCERIIQNDKEFCGMYNTITGERVGVTFDSVSQQTLEDMARRMSNIEVSEIEVGGDVPNAITFFDMYGVSKLNEFHVEERWKKNRTYENMKSLVGQKAGGVPCYLDVHEKYHGPHGLVAGTTGSGKSETLQTYMLSLAINFSPDDIGFFIIDYKGGGMANLFNGLPHILGQISNLSGNQVRRAMVSIKSENKRRQRVFNEHGVNNINAYTMLYKNGEAAMPVPHMFIIIDEFAELKREEGDFMKELISVAQVGRSLGVHLILATQKPSGTVDDNIWSNSKFRLCLRVQDRQDSIDMLHKADAAYLTQAGRCYLQVGNDELYELFQSGWSGAVYDEDSENSRQVLAVMLADTGKAALVGGHVKRRRKEKAKLSWLDKLCGYLEESISEWDMNEANSLNLGETRREFLEENMFELLAEDGVDFPQNDYNSRSLQNVVTLYDSMKEKGMTDRQQICAGMLKGAETLGLKLPEVKDKTQLDAVVKYLAEVAEREGYKKPQQLWLPVLPAELVLESLAGYQDILFDGAAWPQYPEKWELKTFIGLCDNPKQQAQTPLLLNFTEDGHHAVCGISMSGKSTLLQSIVYSLIHKYSPDYLNLYMLDFSSRMLGVFEGDPHVGGVLYESDLDTIGKFFHLIEGMVKERKQMFRGGNYSQYVMTHGVTCPVVLIVIDNIAGFREKTEFQYDDTLMQLSRECAAYGIYLLISGAGFNTSEIPIRLRDNIHRVICMEMMDRFQYGDCLNMMQLSVIPEPGIHGRGLAIVNGEALEFQAALPLIAPDDYKRGEEIQKECQRMSACWEGKRARQIPKIPEKPEWSEFAKLDTVQTLAADDRSLPVGYNMETADIYSIDLSRNYCYLISGKGRTGKTNFLKLLMCSARMKGGELAVVEIGGQELERFAGGLEARYVNTYADYAAFIKEFVPVFQERNRIKKQCLSMGLEEPDIYSRLHEEKPYFIFIADLAAFTAAMHGPEGTRDNMFGAMSNLFEKGFLHNIFFFACLNQDQRMDVMGKDVFEKFIRAKAGIHLGGNVTAQRIFDFNGMPFAEQSAVEKPGVGAVPPTDNEPYHKIMIPLVKGQPVV